MAYGPAPTASASLGNFLEVQILGPKPELLYQKLGGAGCGGTPICILTSPLSDPDAC